MCGIAGIVNWGDRRILERMTDIQAHRGPDDRGVWEDTRRDGAWLGLGARRLAIQDLSPAGHMPMSTADGRITVVFNGEIYNYPHLRRELEGKGYRFRSRSDTESLLYLYLEHGPEFVRRLNGMFAIGLWDSAEDLLFLARDHFGVKPLYYAHQGDKLAFASEIKALLEIPDLPRELDLEGLSRYLTFLWVPDPGTILRDIHKLPAGHYAELRSGRLRVTPFWDLEFPPRDHAFERDEATLAEELRWRFGQAVRGQLIGDVPVGAFLSAGLDSSSIVAAMSEAGARPVRTFTIAFPAADRRGEVHLDDPRVAGRTAKRFGCDHTEIVVHPDIVELLPKLVWHMDEPVADPAVIMAFLVSREARREITVLLSGVGGDEVFAGYRKYRGHYLAERFRRIPAPLRTGWIEPAILALPVMRGTPLKGYVRLAKKMAAGVELPPQQRFLMASTYLTEEQKADLYSPPTRGRIDGAHPWSVHLQHFDRVGHADFLNQMLYVDVKTFMASLNLNYNDKMSMASSVEVRVPFLDPALAEWVAWNVPPGLKLRRGRTKHLLREAMKPLLPPEVLSQGKAAFGAPIDAWITNDLQEVVGDLLSESEVRRRGLFDPVAVRRFLDEQRDGARDWSFQIWQLLTLELWMRAFLDPR